MRFFDETNFKTIKDDVEKIDYQFENFQGDKRSNLDLQDDRYIFYLRH